MYVGTAPLMLQGFMQQMFVYTFMHCIYNMDQKIILLVSVHELQKLNDMNYSFVNINILCGKSRQP